MDHIKTISAFLVCSLELIAPPCIAQGDSLCRAPIDTVRILEASIAPYNGMVQQSIRRKGAKKIFLGTYGKLSTGFFIGPRVLLTNAHNMHSPFGSRVIRYAGSSARAGRFHRSVSRLMDRKAVRKACWIPAAYTWNDFGNDYAIVKFPTKQPAQTTAFELFPADSILNECDTVFITGYPANTKSGYDLYLAKGVVTHLNKGESTFNYTNWSETGNSGSPVWVLRNGRYLVVGIHAGTNAKGPVAKKVDKAFMDSVDAWVNLNAP